VSKVGGTDDLWEAMSTARAIRRFSDEPVDDATLRRCFEAATQAPSGEAMLRGAVGVPDMWMLAAHVVVGWPRGRHGPLRRRPMTEVVALDHWDSPAWGDGALWNPHGI